jgi:hypothetical protein
VEEVVEVICIKSDEYFVIRYVINQTTKTNKNKNAFTLEYVKKNYKTFILTSHLLSHESISKINIEKPKT